MYEIFPLHETKQDNSVPLPWPCSWIIQLIDYCQLEANFIQPDFHRAGLSVDNKPHVNLDTFIQNKKDLSVNNDECLLLT